MNWTSGQRKAALAREKRWVDSLSLSLLQELRAENLVKGAQAVFHHTEGCRLYAGGKCGLGPPSATTRSRCDRSAVKEIERCVGC
jgi:hypothetical protein